MTKRVYIGSFVLLLFHLLTIGLLHAREEKKDVSLQRVISGIFTIDVPADWEVLAGNEELQARRETEGSIKQMIDRYSTDTDSEQEYLGIQSYKAIRISNRAGKAEEISKVTLEMSGVITTSSATTRVTVPLGIGSVGDTTG